MTNKTFMTIVVEYDSEADMPAINANQPVLGGRIVGLAWNHVIAELHLKDEQLQILESVITKHGLEDERDEMAAEYYE